MRKVFVTNYSNVNYETLEEYGKVEVMTHGYVDLSDMKKLYAKIKPFLESSNPDDYLALSGASGVCAAIVHFWVRHHGMARMLCFNRRQGVKGGYQESILLDIITSSDDAGKEKVNS